MYFPIRGLKQNEDGSIIENDHLERHYLELGNKDRAMQLTEILLKEGADVKIHYDSDIDFYTVEWVFPEFDEEFVQVVT